MSDCPVGVRLGASQCMQYTSLLGLGSLGLGLGGLGLGGGVDLGCDDLVALQWHV